MPSSDRLSEQILKLMSLFRHNWDFATNSVKMDSKQESELEELWEDIVEYLIWFPGTLIFIADESERRFAQSLINFIWGRQSIDVTVDKILSGGYSGLLVNIIGDYVERAKMLKPVFISINPKNLEIYKYYDEAMKAWLYGLNSSALILCCSIIEDTFKAQLYAIDPDLALDLERQGSKVTGVKNKKIEKLIEAAYKYHIIDKKGRAAAHGIRILRNNAIHSLEEINQPKTYQAILDTKELIEKILTTSTTSW